MTQPINTIDGDMLRTNTWYTLTVCPNDPKQYHGMKDQRLELVLTYFDIYHFSKWKKHGIEYILYPEISTPKPSNFKGLTRIHFHGKIRFKGIEGLSKWYMHDFDYLKKTCMIEVDTIQSKEKWEQYITKNEDPMRQICKYQRLPYPLSDDLKTLKRLKRSVSVDEIVLPESIDDKFHKNLK